eukprot:TRINITY_DN16049_c0_g1_i1.p1 TRINITY_DN16049_c0_g1~~TRINITY_DN16049_c0_g1_i1.p1  ORF type:complete len:119 (-),score=26.86 TRINITY_DN16049_c0_g1_i1:33-389(-)
MQRFFTVRGNVQNVMFRQTFIRAVVKRGLKAGASNDRADRNKVSFTFAIDADGGKQEEQNARIEEIVEFMRAGKKLNDWGAKVDSIEELSHGLNWNEHQVTTANVDSFQWNPNVVMYL